MMRKNWSVYVLFQEEKNTNFHVTRLEYKEIAKLNDTMELFNCFSIHFKKPLVILYRDMIIYWIIEIIISYFG